MSIESPTTQQMSQVLDIIHDIAVKAASVDGIPLEVDEALDKIVSLSRYKINVINSKTLAPE